MHFICLFILLYLKCLLENRWGSHFINTVSCGRYISYNVPSEGIKYITKLLQFNTAQDCRFCRNCSILHLIFLLSKLSTCTLEFGQYNHFIFEVQTLNYAQNLKYGPLQKQINKKWTPPFQLLLFYLSQTATSALSIFWSCLDQNIIYPIR